MNPEHDARRRTLVITVAAGGVGKLLHGECPWLVLCRCSSAAHAGSCRVFAAQRTTACRACTALSAECSLSAECDSLRGARVAHLLAVAVCG